MTTPAAGEGGAAFAPLTLEQGLHLLDILTWFPSGDPDRWSRIAEYVGGNVPAAATPSAELCALVVGQLLDSDCDDPEPSGHGRWQNVPRAKRLYQLKYDLMTMLYPDDWFLFMNMGYEGAAPADWLALGLAPEHRLWQFAANLYSIVVPEESLVGREVIEVGSGRGGGACLLNRTRQPRRYVGIDYSERNVRFCQDTHIQENLSFVHGDAERLPFPDDSFDVLINVESAHCYPDVDRFFAETWRVLRPEGQFRFADEWWTGDVSALYRRIEAAGLRIVETEDITAGVIRALELLPPYVDEVLRTMHAGERKDLYTRFFTERVCNHSAYSYTSGRFVFVRVVATRS